MSRRTAKKEGPHRVDIHVGLRMRLRRTELSMSQTMLGECLGITFQQIQKYERGANRISASMLYDAANALSVTTAYFFVGLDDGAGSEAPAADYLAATPRAHRIMRGILDLPQPIQTRLESLIEAIREEGAADDGSEP